SQAAERRGAPGTARRDDGGGRPPSGGRPQAASREGPAQPGPDPRPARRPAHGSRRRRPPRARGGPGGPDRPRLRPHPSRRPDVGRPRRSRDGGRAPPLRGAGPPRIVVTGVEVIARKDPSYPSVLEEIADPPERLWVRGTLPVGPAVAIVGTRRATRYGLSLGREMGRAVARAGWVVVSGLARGIDGAAHRGCIDADGRGIAVLGCGIDVWYPPEHEALRRQLVAAGGAVGSEYPLGICLEPWRFPARNRIISALAAAVVVVEAAAKGGAWITARLAAEQGRDVFAVPGDVHRDTSRGTNLLIRDGAVPVLGADDLIEALSLVLGPPRPVPSTSPPLEVPHEGATLEEIVEANGGDAAAVLQSLGRMEAEGSVRIEAGQVFFA